jgi:dTDP-D-glucose 4,6-dehydratase
MHNIDVVTTICHFLDKLRPCNCAGSRRDLITYAKNRTAYLKWINKNYAERVTL